MYVVHIPENYSGSARLFQIKVEKNVNTKAEQSANWFPLPTSRAQVHSGPSPLPLLYVFGSLNGIERAKIKPTSTQTTMRFSVNFKTYCSSIPGKLVIDEYNLCNCMSEH